MGNVHGVEFVGRNTFYELRPRRAIIPRPISESQIVFFQPADDTTQLGTRCWPALDTVGTISELNKVVQRDEETEFKQSVDQDQSMSEVTPLDQDTRCQQPHDGGHFSLSKATQSEKECELESDAQSFAGTDDGFDNKNATPGKAVDDAVCQPGVLSFPSVRAEDSQFIDNARFDGPRCPSWNIQAIPQTSLSHRDLFAGRRPASQTKNHFNHSRLAENCLQGTVHRWVDSHSPSDPSASRNRLRHDREKQKRHTKALLKACAEGHAQSVLWHLHAEMNRRNSMGSRHFWYGWQKSMRVLICGFGLVRFAFGTVGVVGNNISGKQGLVRVGFEIFSAKDCDVRIIIALG